MITHNWSKSEKLIARAAFEKALGAEQDALVAGFKQRAARIERADELQKLIEWTQMQARRLDATFDYRYSQLIRVFAELVATRKLDIEELDGLDSAKLTEIAGFAEFIRKGYLD